MAQIKVTTNPTTKTLKKKVTINKSEPLKSYGKIILKIKDELSKHKCQRI